MRTGPDQYAAEEGGERKPTEGLPGTAVHESEPNQRTASSNA
jgi:hypothetical protein